MSGTEASAGLNGAASGQIESRRSPAPGLLTYLGFVVMAVILAYLTACAAADPEVHMSNLAAAHSLEVPGEVDREVDGVDSPEPKNAEPKNAEPTAAEAAGPGLLQTRDAAMFRPLPAILSPAVPSAQVQTVTSTVAATARVQGVLHGARAMDVTVRADSGAFERPSVVQLVSYDPSLSPAPFVFDIDGLPPGPQSVCVDDTCHRVLVAEQTQETPDEINQKILAAMARATQLFDFADQLPSWNVIVAGPSTGAGGHFNPSERTIAISGTSGRTVDEFTTTILHEVGHAVDASFLSEEDRERFRELRGIDPTLPWFPAGLAPEDRWASPAEDFSEVFLAWLTDGLHQTRSQLSGQPTSDDLLVFSQLVDDLT